MNEIEKLLAIEEIKQLKARYFRSMDTKDESLYRSVLTEDYSFDAPGIITDPITGYSPYPDPTTSIVRGRDVCVNAIFAAIRHPDYSSFHTGHMPEIEIVDDNNAKGIWSMTDVIGFAAGDGTKGNFIGYGHYYDTYRREDGVWKIASVKLVRHRVDYPYDQAWLDKAKAASADKLDWAAS